MLFAGRQGYIMEAYWTLRQPFSGGLYIFRHSRSVPSFAVNDNADSPSYVIEEHQSHNNEYNGDNGNRSDDSEH